VRVVGEVLAVRKSRKIQRKFREILLFPGTFLEEHRDGRTIMKVKDNDESQISVNPPTLCVESARSLSTPESLLSA
jgi:hypothetical protein